MISSRFFRTVKHALKSLMLHKLRSGLTMLGIVFGVFSVIAMLAIGEGASRQAQQEVLRLGATNVILVSVKPPKETQADASSGRRGGRFQVVRYGLLHSDFELLSATVPNAVKVIPIREIYKEASHNDRRMNIRLVACTADYREVNSLHLAKGRFITDQDQKDIANVCVLAHETAMVLFRFENPLGQAVQIGNQIYKVVGVTESRTASAAVGGSLSGQDFNKDIYIPIKTFQSRFGDLDIQFTPGNFSAEYVELNQITIQLKDREHVIPTSEVIRESIDRTHADRKDVSVVVPLELLKQADQLRQIFNVVLGSIAAISLVVGGIGIMNIMLATVTERTREIGIRRALGARRRDIIHQFLTETVVLAGTGGLIGIALGLLTPYAFKGIRWFATQFILEGATSTSEIGRIFSEMEPAIAIWSLPLAFGISVGIGVGFGMYPARAAAQLDPIEALRHE